MSSIGLVVAGQTHGSTNGKFGIIAHLLRQAGHDVVTLAWDAAAIAHLQERREPLLIPRLTNYDHHMVEESKRLHALLTKQIVEVEGAPTWGSLLAFDDFIGGAQAWNIEGLGSWTPDILVGATHGAESSTPEDEVMLLNLWRWATISNIPQIALEVQADGPLEISNYPVQYRLNRDRMPPVHRHYCLPWADPFMETALVQEQEIKRALEAPGEIIVVPFHLYYLQECMDALKELGEWKKQEQWEGMVVVPVGRNFRRKYGEQDIVIEGCKRWWRDLEQIQVVANFDAQQIMAVSDGVFAKYDVAAVSELHRRYGVPLWRCKQEIQMPKWVSVVDVVRQVEKEVQK